MSLLVSITLVCLPLVHNRTKSWQWYVVQWSVKVLHLKPFHYSRGCTRMGKYKFGNVEYGCWTGLTYSIPGVFPHWTTEPRSRWRATLPWCSSEGNETCHQCRCEEACSCCANCLWKAVPWCRAGDLVGSFLWCLHREYPIPTVLCDMCV